MRACRLTIIVILISAASSHAHNDFLTFKDFGNVKVRVSTGFNYEEITKAWIIGEMVYQLSRKLKYTDTIFLDFHHHYIQDCTPDYFVTINDGSVRAGWHGSRESNYIKKDVIVIGEISRRFTPVAILNLTEYAIQNFALIKKEQQIYSYKKNYSQFHVNTISFKKTEEIALQKTSSTINEILACKFYDPASQTSSISYYFQNNKYHIYFKRHKESDSVLLILNNIYQFTSFPTYDAIAFENDSTFFYIGGVNNPFASQSMVIKEKHEVFRPYEVKKLGYDKIAISFEFRNNHDARRGRERTLIYYISKNELIQNMDDAIKK